MDRLHKKMCLTLPHCFINKGMVYELIFFVANCPDDVLGDMNCGNGCPLIILFTSNESLAFVERALRALALDVGPAAQP